MVENHYLNDATTMGNVWIGAYDSIACERLTTAATAAAAEKCLCNNRGERFEQRTMNLPQYAVKRNKNNETIRIGVQYAHAGCFILIHRQRKPFSVSLYKLNFKFQIFCNSQLASHTAAATGQLCCNYVWLKN